MASGGRRRFDKGGDQFYDQISALHKAVRGTDPDAALYWLCRMLDGGCDPLYIARRVVRMAVEDVGLADPRAFALTLDAWEAYDRLGSPGGRVGDRECGGLSRMRAEKQRRLRRDGRSYGRRRAVRHAGCAATAAQRAYASHEGDGLWRRDIATRTMRPMLMRPGSATCLTSMPDRRYYRPVPRGLEIKIGEALERLRGNEQG